MDEISIQGVILTPLKIITNSKGDIYHGIKNTDAGFSKFGEAYFSFVKSNMIKGWNKHLKMTLNLIVPVGVVTFVIYDDRDNSTSKGSFYRVELSPDNFYRLTISPGLWLAFKGKGKGKNLILNVADLEHNTDELEKTDLENIDYNWDMV